VARVGAISYLSTVAHRQPPPHSFTFFAEKRLSKVNFNNKHDHGFADACEGFVKDLVNVLASYQWPISKLFLDTFLHSLVRCCLRKTGCSGACVSLVL
jgi:hypothetical protein